MKKIFAVLLAVMLLLSLAACGSDKEDNSGASQPSAQGGASAQDGKVTDETKLGESITYNMDGENLIIKIKTSAEFDAKASRIAIVNPGVYLTRDSEAITQCLFDERCFDESFDKEWFDGVYTFKIDSRITDIASNEEWAPGTWSMMLYEGESNTVIGQWLYVAEGGGKYHFEFKDSWLVGAGEDKPVKEFESEQEKIASWFTLVTNECTDDWAVIDFDGYYLEETDPEGYDKYYLMVCPEGSYKTYEDADAVDITYCDIYERCPYKLSFEQNIVENGKYTIVLAKMGGNVEVQFNAEKVSPTEWNFDFENAVANIA